MVFLLKNALSDNVTLYQTMWRFIRQCNILSDNVTPCRGGLAWTWETAPAYKEGLVSTEGFLEWKIIIFALGIINMFFIEFNKMLKVSLTNRGWNDYVGYWNWIKVFHFKTDQTRVFQFFTKSCKSAFLWRQVGAGKGYKLTLGQFLNLYSTLGDALSPDPCQDGPRPANQNFSARWAEQVFL